MKLNTLQIRYLLAILLACVSAYVIGWDLPTRTFVFLTTFWAFSPSVRVQFHSKG